MPAGMHVIDFEVANRTFRTEGFENASESILTVGGVGGVTSGMASTRVISTEVEKSRSCGATVRGRRGRSLHSVHSLTLAHSGRDDMNGGPIMVDSVGADAPVGPWSPLMKLRSHRGVGPYRRWSSFAALRSHRGRGTLQACGQRWRHCGPTEAWSLVVALRPHRGVVIGGGIAVPQGRGTLQMVCRLTNDSVHLSLNILRDQGLAVFGGPHDVVIQTPERHTDTLPKCAFSW
jgi:hypothetical protein